MEQRNFDRLGKAFYNLAYAKGYQLATGETGSGWMKYNAGDFEAEFDKPFPKTDPLNDEDVNRIVEEWEQTDQARHELRDIIGRLEPYRNDDDWIHLYSEIRVGFESGYLEAMITIEADYGA